MKVRPGITFVVILMTIGMATLAKALPEPLSWRSTVEASRIGVVASVGTATFLLDRQLSAYPHVGGPIEIFNPNARILRVRPGG
jgi:heme A synthase